jgi:putative NADPH-quinone reductase
MIINFHPVEIPSKTGAAIIADLQSKDPNIEAFVPSSKTVEQWQNIIKSSEPIIMVAPIYWWGAGYEFDKWLQGVFDYNFAFSFDSGTKEGLLEGREFIIYMTHKTPDMYAQSMLKNITDRLEQGIFGYCNAKININFVEQK